MIIIKYLSIYLSFELTVAERQNDVSIFFVIFIQERSQCGTHNNGCQQRCSNGVCSCNPGYNLVSDGKNCTGKDCKMPKPTFCAPG